MLAKEDNIKKENRLRQSYKAQEETKSLLDKEKRRVKGLREK